MYSRCFHWFPGPLAPSEKGDKVSSKVGVFMCKLKRKGRKYEVEVSTVLEVLGTEKGRSQKTISEYTFGDGLSDC